MGLNVYLNFFGNTKEVVEFYAKVFDVKTNQIMTYGMLEENNLDDQYKDYVIYTYLDIEGSMLMFSDVLPFMEFKVGNNVSINYTTKDLNRIKNIYNALIQDGKIELELQKTAWSDAYASIVDKFGICWQLNLQE